jgi:sugar lactone lactonase YvrE
MQSHASMRAVTTQARSALPWALGSLCVLLAVACPGRSPAASDVRIEGARVYPESITSSADGTLYIGSLGGTIYRAAPGARSALPWIRADGNGLLSIFGVLADDRTRTLWVCSSPVALPGGRSDGTSSVMRFDLASGAKKGESRLPEPKALCDDIAIGPDGAAYIADITSGEILVLRKLTEPLQVFAHDSRLKGIDGIAFAADGVLYIDNVARGQLLRVNRTVQGDFDGLTELAVSTPLGGPDGLRPIADHRFVLAEGRARRIDVVTILGDRANVEVLSTALQSPSSATVVGSTVYALEGKIEYLVDPKLRAADPGPFIVRALPLPRETSAPPRP